MNNSGCRKHSNSERLGVECLAIPVCAASPEQRARFLRTRNHNRGRVLFYTFPHTIGHDRARRRGSLLLNTAFLLWSPPIAKGRSFGEVPDTLTLAKVFTVGERDCWRLRNGVKHQLILVIDFETKLHRDAHLCASRLLSSRQCLANRRGVGFPENFRVCCEVPLQEWKSGGGHRDSDAERSCMAVGVQFHSMVLFC